MLDDLRFLNRAKPFDRKMGDERVSQGIVRGDELRIGMRGESDVQAGVHGSVESCRDAHVHA